MTARIGAFPTMLTGLLTGAAGFAGLEDQVNEHWGGLAKAAGFAVTLHRDLAGRPRALILR